MLTEKYIKKIKFKKNREKAHQYNRRTSFKVISGNSEVDDEKEKAVPQELDVNSRKEFEALYDNSNQKLVINKTRSNNNTANFVWHVKNWGSTYDQEPTLDSDFELNNGLIKVYFDGVTEGIVLIKAGETKHIELQQGEYKVLVVDERDSKTSPISTVYNFDKGYEAIQNYYIIIGIDNK